MKFHIINKQKIFSKTPLKKIILENFCRENGKFFYSIEVTPKEETKIDFTKLNIQPLFVDITWIKNFNLITPIEDAPALKLANEIKSTHVVNSVTCYGLEDHHIEKVLRSELKLKNFTVLRGDYVDSEQKYKFANELIKEIRRKTSSEEVTIFCAGYPNTHNEAANADEDLQNLERKVESGVDAILTQVVFSSSKFVDFIKNCRKVGISQDIPIIPGLYIPFNFNELNLMLNIAKVKLDHGIYQSFEQLKDNNEEFKTFSLNFMIKVISEIQETSPEFIRGFHFFTLNNFEMVEKLIEIVNFSEM